MYREDNLQIAVSTYLDCLGVLWMHPANERRTSIQAGARLKAKGVKSGVPDILIFTPTPPYNGLAIELKIKPNKTTPNQKKWLKSLENASWLCKVCYSFDEAKEIIDHYLNQKSL